MRGKGQGWVTAEYSMLPGLVARADRPRGGAGQARAGARWRSSGSSAARCGPSCDLVLLGERQVVVDCDVLQADGGTRTASICGGYLALHDALARLVAGGQAAPAPAARRSAPRSASASSTPSPVLDLPYVEDSRGRGRHERRDAPVWTADASSRCRARPRARPSAGASSTRCSAWPRAASSEIFALQAEYVAEPPARRALTGG